MHGDSCNGSSPGSSSPPAKQPAEKPRGAGAPRGAEGTGLGPRLAAPPPGSPPSPRPRARRPTHPGRGSLMVAPGGGAQGQRSGSALRGRTGASRCRRVRAVARARPRGDAAGRGGAGAPRGRRAGRERALRRSGGAALRGTARYARHGPSILPLLPGQMASPEARTSPSSALAGISEMRFPPPVLHLLSSRRGTAPGSTPGEAFRCPQAFWASFTCLLQRKRPPRMSTSP